MQQYLELRLLPTNAKVISTAADASFDQRQQALAWLQSAIAAQTPMPISFNPIIANYTARVRLHEGALLISVYRQASLIMRLAIVPISSHRVVFDALVNVGMARPDQEPRSPFCAVTAHPELVLPADVVNWFFNFQVCCSWAWILKNE